MTRMWAAAVSGAATIMLGAALSACGPSAAEQANSGGNQAKCTDSKTGGGLTIVLETSPCPVKGGASTSAHIVVKDSSGTPVKDATVQIATDMASMGMHGGDHKAEAAGDGYDAKIVLGMGGDWQVRVQVARGTTPAADVQFTVQAK
jgi:hypothetical protein